MRVLIIALTSSRKLGVLDDVAFLADHGATVEVVTLRADDWPELAGAATVHELGPAEGRHPLPRTERWLLFRLPAATFRGIRRLTKKLASLPGGTRPARLIAQRFLAAQRAWERVAGAGHQRGFMRFYRMVRPWVLWRAARRAVLPSVDLRTVDRVVVADAMGIPIGWHLARKDPRLEVTLGLDRSTVNHGMSLRGPYRREEFPGGMVDERAGGGGA